MPAESNPSLNLGIKSGCVLKENSYGVLIIKKKSIIIITDDKLNDKNQTVRWTNFFCNTSTKTYN